MSLPDGCAGQIVHCAECAGAVEVPCGTAVDFLSDPSVTHPEAIRECSTALPGPLAPYLPARGHDILIWRFSTTFLSLLVVADDYIAWANDLSLDGQRLAEEKLQRTRDPRILVRWGATVLGTDDLVAIRTNKYANWLEIRHHRSLKQEINFTSRKERDRFFSAAAERLRLVQDRRQYGPFKAAVAPVLNLLLVLAVMVLGMIASADARGRDQREGPLKSDGSVGWLVHSVVAGVGPARFAVAGLCAAAGLLLWMFVRMRKPPLILTLWSPGAQHAGRVAT
jgi:hypothetical protein